MLNVGNVAFGKHVAFEKHVAYGKHVAFGKHVACFVIADGFGLHCLKLVCCR